MADTRKDVVGGEGVAGSGTGGVHDADGAFEMLREALAAVVDGRVGYADLRTPVRQLCVFAHSEQLSAEELLIRFKEIWAQLPPLAGLPRGRQRNDLMARVATMCIEEYYAQDSSAKSRDSAGKGRDGTEKGRPGS